MEAESREQNVVEELRGLLSLELSPNFELLQTGVLYHDRLVKVVPFGLVSTIRPCLFNSG